MRYSMRMVLALGAILVLVSCGESEEEIYEEGYNDGQFDVCRELRDIAPGLKDRLRHCRGY